MNTLAHLPTQGHLWNDFHFSKRAALHAIVGLRLRSNNHRGKGNKAAKRAAIIETNQWFDHHARLDARDIDAMYAELRSEGRVL